MTEILDLRIAEHPAAPGREVKLFQDSAVAFSHMRDHLLSQPECHAWDLLDSGFGEVVDLENPGSRWRFAHEAACSHGSNSRDLFNLYCDVITRNLEEATWLNWHASVDGVTVALGTDGVLSIIEGDTLRTAFLPGQGSPEAVRRSRQESCSGGALPREGARGGGGFSRRMKFDVTGRKETSWTPDERLYYRVFRPAVKFIRKCHYHDGKFQAEDSGSHYGLLKRCLPGMKALSLNNWIEKRRSTRVVPGIAS